MSLPVEPPRWRGPVLLAASHPTAQAWRSAIALLCFALPTYRFLRVALARFSYPFDLEWTEGGMLLAAKRLLDGLPLYGPPSLDFIPFMYTPGHYAVIATIARVTGLGYGAPRLVSVVATLGTGFLIALLARRAGNTLPLALAWAGLWFATYPLSGFFFDLVRVDALLTFLLVAAIAVLLEDCRRPRSLTLWGLVGLTVAAVLTKQNAVVYGVAAAASLAVSRSWRRAAAFVALACSLLGLTVLALQWSSGGWFWFYTVIVPAHAGFDWGTVLNSVGSSGLGSLPLAWLALPGLAVLARLENGEEGPISWKPIVAIVVAAVISDLGMAGHVWGYRNVHMPLHACLVLAAAVAAPALVRATRMADPSPVPAWLLVGFGLQLWATFFDLERQLPKPDAERQSNRVVHALSTLHGRTLAPEFPWLLHQAGSPACFHISALGDLETAAQHGVVIDLDVLTRQTATGVAWYLRGRLDPPPRLAPLFGEGDVVSFGQDNRAWPPVTGAHSRPTRLLGRP